MRETRWIDRYMMIPYRDGGRDRRGADCFGLVALVIAEEAGAVLRELGAAWSDGLAAIAERVRAEIASGDYLRIGGPELIVSPLVEKLDLVQMRCVHAGGASAELHIGIATGAGTVLHTEQLTGPVHLPLDDMRVRGRVVGFWRLRALSRATAAAEARA